MNQNCIFSELSYICRMKYEILQYRHGDGIVKATINDFWLCSLKKGSIHLNCDLKEYKLSGKTIFVVSEGAPFKVLDSSDDMELEVIVFGTQFMNVVYSLLGAEADFGSLEQSFWTDKRLKSPYSKIMTADYNLVQIALKQPLFVARNKMITASLVHLLIAIYNAEYAGKGHRTNNNDKRSRQVLNHFFELLDEFVPTGQRNVSFYAAKLCISERYLFRVCKIETELTPKDFIDQTLTAQIKNLLLITEMSNQQIANQLDFPDQSAFGQYFKRQTGMSPKAFRAKYK